MIVVRLTPLAEAELEAIADYIARDNPRRALSFVQELRDRCLSLADMPLAFPLVPRYEARGIRHRVHGNYQIFYRVVGDPPSRIDVLHVLHSARNYAALLFN
ncbi:type II toxin-antitoxin system RelE/ParE family toxin [Cupriavidus lacunae]|uniref:Type II toxin-antitoxin system RelE/ParE family toxin n=1 Tax=Cupriavidus lacunae TaxID=2666307 RepID=A0A370NNU0_9BURK|nr:type II toxin-antitoxin system RelE/ParE family toxin [Cupriavidus lacunae]RDK07239.1 type II toxin-antitoxin system RelE/ParE family toxin [Cupriavidus lacunae]